MKSSTKIRWGLLATLLVPGLLAGFTAGPASAATLVVTTTADPGVGGCTALGAGDGCTLREAIIAANNQTLTPGADTIDATGVSGVITLKVNNTTILTSTNKTGFTSGNIMLGYDDGFDSVGPSTSVVIFDNVRVVTQGSLAINKTGIAGTDVQIDFTDSTTGPWTLLTATGVSTNSADYSAVGAVFTTVSGGHYRATTPYSKTEFSRFYRVRRN